MSNSIKNSAISGAKWNGLLSFGKYFITFFLSIILARLLDPKEFGLIGMLSLFTAIATVFIDSGLSMALIRSKNIDNKDLSTVFYFNITVSTFFYLILFFGAPFIAKFYDQPILISLTRWVSLIFIINSFGLIQNTILIKELNFKKQAICNLIGLVVSVVISAMMAFHGYGVYSIVGQAISQAMVTNILFWFSSRWRPRDGFKKASFLKLWSFGSKVLATNIVTRIVDNLDNLLIGKVFSATQLGFFVRAKSSKHMPEQILTGILQAVSFPVLTKVCDDEIEFRRLHLRFLQLSLYVYFPVIFGFIAASKAFIVVLYTSKWLPALPYLQIILLSSFAYFLGALFNQTIMAKGKAKMYFRINTAKKIIVLAAIPFGIWGGILSFVWAITIISIIRLFIDAYFVGKLMKIKIFEYLKIVLKPFIIAGLMFALVYPINFLTIKSDLLILALQIAVGLISYICFSLIFKLEEFHEVRSIIFNQISGISSKIIGKNK